MSTRFERRRKEGPCVLAYSHAAPASAAAPGLRRRLARRKVGEFLVKVPPARDDPVMAGLIEELFPPPPPSVLDDADDGGGADAPSGRVAVAISVFVDPEHRARGLGDVMFRASMRACAAAGYGWMLFVHQDNGSGRLVAWYEAMGFRRVPEDNALGISRGMLGPLPAPDEPYYADIAARYPDVEHSWLVDS